MPQRQISICLRFLLGLVAVAWAISPPLQSAQPRKIGVLIETATSPFGRSFNEGFHEAAKKMGVEVLVQAPTNIDSNDMYMRIVRGWERGNFDAIILAPRVGFEEIFVEPMKGLKERGVKVLTVMEPLPAGIADAHVAVDENGLNAAALEHCASLLQDGDEMIVLRANTNTGKPTDREQKIIQGLRRRFPKLVMHADRFMSRNNDPKIDMDQAKALLEAYPKSRLFYSPYTYASLATIKALRATGKVGKIHHVCVGTGVPFETLKAIEEGAVDAWVALLPKLVAQKALEICVDVLDGKTVAPASYGKFYVVTKANLNTPETEALVTR